MATVLVPLTTTRHLLQIHRPLFSRRPPVQRGQVVHRPFPAGYCLTPTLELSKTERDPISTIGPSLYSVCHQTGRSLRTDQTFAPHSPPHNLTVLSWLGALYARGSRRACRTAISRNASSLLALPDFPEFAPAVRYGVPGTPRRVVCGCAGLSGPHSLHPLFFPPSLTASRPSASSIPGQARIRREHPFSSRPRR